MGISTLVDVGKRVASDVSSKNVPFMAAGIAYTAFVSLAPLLILLFIVVTVVGGGLEQRLLAVAQRSLPGPIAALVTQVFSGEQATGASFIGLVVLVWGTLKVFRGLDTAFSEIYETDGDNSFVDTLLDGAVVLVALVTAIVSTVAVSAVFARFEDQVPFLGLVTPLVLVGGLVVAFYPMYARFPDTALGWRDVLPGAVVGAVGWAAFQVVFQVYLVLRGDGAGSFFGGVLIVVTWLYFSGLVLLIGAVVNAVIGGHSTGSGGGLGRGAASRRGDIESTTTLDRDELAGYVRDLRRRLTDHYEELETGAEVTNREHRPLDCVEIREYVGTVRTVRPLAPTDGTVTVVERSRRDGDQQEVTVTIRWRDPEGDEDEDRDGS